jgi:homeobox protein cut-like
MYEYWKKFDLPELQKELDSLATSLAARQDESEVSRRNLVELSREFKKATPEDVRKVVAPLLKSFQAEIDALSRRSKNAEAAFLTTYKKLIDIPDPVTALEHAQQLQARAHRAYDLEVQNRQLRDRLDEYNNEFAEVKNQEVTVKQLKDRLKESEDKMEMTALAKVKEKEKELSRQFAEKERQLQETQMVVAKKLGEAEHRVATLQSALDGVQSELFDMKAKYDEATSAKSDEMDMLLLDCDRANERAAAAERQCDQMRQQLLTAAHAVQTESKTAPDMEHAIDILKCSSLEVELAAKEREVTQLVDDIQRLQATVNKLRDTSTSQVARLEEDLAGKTRTLAILEEKLATQADYDEIKREFRVLKSLEFTGSGSDDAAASSSHATVDETSKANSLETLLLGKNRALQTENTQLRVASAELTGRYNKMQEQFNESCLTVQQQKLLIMQLEEDLRSVNALSAMFRGDAEGEAVINNAQNNDFVASFVKDSDNQPAMLRPIDAEALKSAADSLLPIVQSQRERYRVRAQELETVTVGQQQQVTMLQNELDKLRSDNIKLYEKIKFLQGYAGRGSAVTDDTVVKYSSQYDDNLDPFTSFSKRERMRKYMDLRPYDKITLGMGRFIMGNKVARTVVFFYTLILHVLVFLVLYKMAYTSSCKRDAAQDWQEKFAEHMAQVHGPSNHNH